MNSISLRYLICASVLKLHHKTCCSSCLQKSYEKWMNPNLKESNLRKQINSSFSKLLVESSKFYLIYLHLVMKEERVIVKVYVYNNKFIIIRFTGTTVASDILPCTSRSTFSRPVTGESHHHS